ncbi:unnamed protein product [Prorocentrum cordatum]|uniref:Letm1 RBD domain-containing protein n=1 Tax=Prorocentrum cordatum TaxID=2364126 RepID=A0ABN9U1U1_9DINO|nr:unnamed protein product [Polarella glacialis]
MLIDCAGTRLHPGLAAHGREGRAKHPALRRTGRRPQAPLAVAAEVVSATAGPVQGTLRLSAPQKAATLHEPAQLRHHVASIRREDRDYLWEGIDGLTRTELIEACTKRAIRVSGVDKAEMRANLQRWLELSSHREIPTSALLWVQSFYLLQDEQLAGAGDVRSSLQLDVPQAKAETDSAQEEASAFQDMAGRQAAKVQNLQRSLEELEAEIQKVVVEEVVAAEQNSTAMPQDSAGMDAVAGSTSGSADAAAEDESPTEEPLSAERKQRAKVLRRLRELDEKVHLYKDVIGKQKSLLDNQLHFLNSMRENIGCQQRDPDVILLDQRVRLMEMINSFETDYEAIEEVLSGAKPSGRVEQPFPRGAPAVAAFGGTPAQSSGSSWHEVQG